MTKILPKEHYYYSFKNVIIKTTIFSLIILNNMPNRIINDNHSSFLSATNRKMFFIFILENFIKC